TPVPPDLLLQPESTPKDEAEVSESPVTQSAREQGSKTMPLPASMSGVVGRSEKLLQLYSIVDRVAHTDCTVLVTGESGTGKELVAKALHENSERREKQLVTVNCGAIPEALLESELFGHNKGAFTGASSNRVGRIQSAQGGTLFLDEIGELPLSLQVKLLRVLQYREFSPVGESRVMSADIRVVAATNIDLEKAVSEGKFREDLFYRLNVIHVKTPPLRERAKDIEPLTQHFLESAKTRLGRRDLARFSERAMTILKAWSWPGNVRELENTIERAVLLAQGPTIEPGDLPEKVCGLSADSATPRLELPDCGLNLRKTVESFENRLIQQALEKTRWNKKQAAVLLGINRTTLVEMIKRKQINRSA
ncbi:MAG: sigma-54 dependent transcriptional regulator, partial [Polyangiaceae bacterium]|nr:sigma-54 dependent transcriptional regulator [Polyangiaceae bacterium]